MRSTFFPVVCLIILFQTFHFIIGDDDFPSKMDPNVLQFPWIWDAIFDPNKALVSLTSINRGACDFQVKAWKTFATLFPLHAKTLGSGIPENILIDTHLKYKYPSNSSDYFMRAEGMLGKQFICNYYSANSLVAKSKSLPISIRKELKRVSPVVIFCPVPVAAHSLSDANNSFTHVSLSIIPEDPRPSPYNYLVYNPRNQDVIQEKKSAKALYLRQESDRFPVTALPVSSPEAVPQYGSSVCTAMMSGRRETMVEWIEYHRLIGVDHFFIYNTATSKSGQQALSAILSDYVRESIVTLVPWPYQNCVRNFTNGGRSFFYYLNESRDHKDLRIFKPPNPISQTAALTSCFVRFKSTSKYMIHIDTDEFIAVNKDGVKGLSSSLITSFADRVFDRFALANAIYLRPIMVSFCPHLTTFSTPYFRPNSNSGSQDQPAGYSQMRDKHGAFVLPKLGKWQHGNHGTLHEGKLIMRSDMVDNYFVHYIVQSSSERFQAMDEIPEDLDPAASGRTPPVGVKRKLVRKRRKQKLKKRKAGSSEELKGAGWDYSDGEDNALFIFPKLAALYHFKEEDPFFLTTLIPGQTWNSSEKEAMNRMQCSFKQQLLFLRNNSLAQSGVPEDKMRKAEDRGDFTRHGLTVNEVDELVLRYRNRFQQIP